jgi:molybdate transport system substrate-binding protein
MRSVLTAAGQLIVVTLVWSATLVSSATSVYAEEIRVLSSVGIKTVVEELGPQFEQKTKHKLTMVFDLAGALKTRIEGGEPFDVAILTPAMIDDLIAKGRVASASRTEIARTGLGLMIRAGAPKPDVSTNETFRKTLLSAKSITYVTTGASGVAFLATVEKMGIAEAIKAKSKPAANVEEVGANVLSGAAALAVLPVSEILPVKGAELGGVFPAAAQTYIVMAAGTNAKATSNAGRELVAFLMSAPNTAVIRAKGMER